MQEFNKSSRRSFFGKVAATSLGIGLSGSLGTKLFAEQSKIWISQQQTLRTDFVSGTKICSCNDHALQTKRSDRF